MTSCIVFPYILLFAEGLGDYLSRTNSVSWSNSNNYLVLTLMIQEQGPLCLLFKNKGIVLTIQKQGPLCLLFKNNGHCAYYSRTRTISCWSSKTSWRLRRFGWCSWFMMPTSFRMTNLSASVGAFINLTTKFFPVAFSTARWTTPKAPLQTTQHTPDTCTSTA